MPQGHPVNWILINLSLVACIGDQDIAIRVIAEGLRPEQTIVSKIMTRNPIFVTSDSLAIEALQKMIQGLVYIYIYISTCFSVCYA